MNDLLANIGHLITLPDGSVGTVKAVAQSGNYWVKIYSRYALAAPDKCQLNGRYILPEETGLWNTQPDNG